MARKRVIVSGLVQGVGYRANFQWQAEQRGLKGWVRNLRSGEVEAVVEGEETIVLELIAWAKIGPRHSRVEDVRVSEDSSDDTFQGFDVRPTA